MKGIQSAGTKEPGGGMVGSTSLALTRVRPLRNYYNWYRTCNALVEDKVGSARLRHEPTRYTVGQLRSIRSQIQFNDENIFSSLFCMNSGVHSSAFI